MLKSVFQQNEKDFEKMKQYCPELEKGLLSKDEKDAIVGCITSIAAGKLILFCR